MLKARGLMLNSGTVIDATIVAAPIAVFFCLQFTPCLDKVIVGSMFNTKGVSMRKFVIAGLLLTACGLSFADGAQGSGPNPYTECGIGASIFKETDWAAATSNVTWDLGTTALSSASYSPEMCAPKKVKAAMLIRDNYAQISEEVARGQGEHLSAALELFSCSVAAQPVAATQVRADYGRMVSSASYGGQSQLQKASHMYQVIQTAAQGRCGA